jgi:hypothetical protein
VLGVGDGVSDVVVVEELKPVGNGLTVSHVVVVMVVTTSSVLLYKMSPINTRTLRQLTVKLTMVTVVVAAVYVTLAVLAGTLMQEHAEEMRDEGYDAPFVTQFGGATDVVLAAIVVLPGTLVRDFKEVTVVE